MVCEKILLLHFKSGKISVIIFLGPLLMELHFLFMNGFLYSKYVANVEAFSGGHFMKGAMLQMNFVFLNQDKVDTLVLLFTAVYKCQNQCKW